MTDTADFPSRPGDGLRETDTDVDGRDLLVLYDGVSDQSWVACFKDSLVPAKP